MALLDYSQIEVTTLYELNQKKKTGSGYVKGKYYFAHDYNRIYYAKNKKEIQQKKDIYIVANDVDRRLNVPKINGMEYYCIERNQLWLFDIDNLWKFVAGDQDLKYVENGYYDGRFTFTNSKSYSSESSRIRIKLYKINNVVYGRIVAVDNPTSTLIAKLEADYTPNEDITLVIEKDSSSRFNATINKTTGEFELSDSANLKSLNTSCKFWYVLK